MRHFVPPIMRMYTTFSRGAYRVGRNTLAFFFTVGKVWGYLEVSAIFGVTCIRVNALLRPNVQGRHVDLVLTLSSAVAP